MTKSCIAHHTLQGAVYREHWRPRLALETPKQPSEYRTSCASTTTSPTMPARLSPDPLFQKVFVLELVPIGNLGSNLCLAGIKAQQGRDTVDHVSEPQAGAYHVRCVILDLTKADAAFGLTHARFDKVFDEWGDLMAGTAPAGCPEGDERHA